MRQLASIQKVVSLTAIPKADMIVMAQVLGWECVVKKDEFQPGELGVYFEIDSLLPVQSEFAFLEKCKYRIKTIRLKGQVSQGLLIPLSTIKYVDLSSCKEGDDVTELLGVKKWEPPDPFSGGRSNLRGKVKGTFPQFLSKTDETRIQSYPRLLEDLKDVDMYYAEKVDGSSLTAYFRNGVFGLCSRNLELKRDSTILNAFWAGADKYDLENKLTALNRNIALQGELLGPGIQKNKYHLTEYEVLFFNAYDIDNHKYLDFEEFKALVESLGLKTVPIIETNFRLNHSVKDLVALVTGNSVLLEGALREGFVFRPMKEMQIHRYGRASFKVINPEFLLKWAE